VGDALREAGVVLAPLDQVTPSLDTPIHDAMSIRITRVEERVTYEEELLPFETVWEPDPELIIDARRVGQEGQPGVLRRRYRVRYEDGEEVARELEDEWIAQEPKRKVILYGTKIVPRTAMTPDGPITYWRKIRAYTTSYSPSRSGTDPSLPWYGRTRLGFKAGKGVVGADPSVINMRQKIYVPGYGFGIVGDTGNIGGRHVDLGFDDDNYESWHWWSDVYLLWPPPPSYAINYILPNWPRYKGSRNPYEGLVQERP
jgi:3D (Asp-Asp-Asp) domain-containing protein